MRGSSIFCCWVVASGMVQLSLAASPIPSKPEHLAYVASTGADLLVKERLATTGTVAWRFEMLANYVSHRADIARDGTVYVLRFSVCADANRNVEMDV